MGVMLMKYFVKLRLGNEDDYISSVFPVRWSTKTRRYLFNSVEEIRENLKIKFSLSKDLSKSLSGFINSCIQNIEIYSLDEDGNETFVEKL